MIKLRPYQQSIVDKARESIAQKHLRTVVVAPTGAGKTVMFSYICQLVKSKGGKVLILCHRTKLVDQTVDKLTRFGLKSQRLMAGFKNVSPNVDVYVAMVQTLSRRPEIPDVSLIIADECHIGNFDKLLEGHPKLTLGFTATPERASKKAHNRFAELYNNLVQGTDVPELIDGGFLVPADYYGFNEADELLKVRNGEFVDESNIDYVKSAGLPVDNYEKFAKGSRAMVFCVNVAHVIETYLAFKDRGYSVCMVHSKQTESQNEILVDDFKAGLYDVLINCGILTAGFDDETVQTIIMARATKSLSLWLQICGRGSRPILDANGVPTDEKPEFKVIDLGGNIKRHGMWHMARDWSLTKRKEGDGVAPAKECPECFRIVLASAKECKCGYVFPKAKKKAMEGEIERVLLIGEEAHARITAIERTGKEKGFKHGWIIHNLNNLDLLNDYFTLKGYSQKYWKQLERNYGIKRKTTASNI